MEYFLLPNINKKLSKLVVGTAEMGQNYGLYTLRKPSREESISILSYALEKGINVFDTSPTYGDSEEIIGEFLRKVEKKDVYISTKLEKLPEVVWKNEGMIQKKIREEFQLSCKRLGVDNITIYLVHVAAEAFRNNGIVLDILNEIKKEGKIDIVGVSLYEGNELQKCVEDERVDAVQIPFNVLDKRLLKSGLLERTKERGLTVFARSIFLQGLLLMELERIPHFLYESIEIIKKLQMIATIYKRNLKEICIKYVLESKGINFILVGVNSMEQVEENIRLFNSKPLEPEIMKAIDNLLTPQRYILDPRKWDDLKRVKDKSNLLNY